MKRIIVCLIVSCLPLGCGLLLSGCGPSQPEFEAPSQESASDAGHAAHAHGDTGPHGGHLLHLSPTGAHAEWTHDDENHLITVYLDDFDAEALQAAKFVVTVGEESEEFPLEAGQEGWSINSQALMNHINMGEAAQVQLVVTNDTGDHTTLIEAHEDHHGHSH